MSTKTKPESAIPVLPNGDADSKPCWSCGDMRAANFCSSCGKVQPPAPTDYFSFFGLARSLELDEMAIEKEMFTLSRRLHPDRNARASSQEQDWALQQTSKLNNAYRTLRDPIRRTEYLLRLEGIKLAGLSPQENGAGTKAAPDDLLEEVFELNMQLEEFRAGRKLGEDTGALRADLMTARKHFASKLDDLDVELKHCWQEWDEFLAREDSGADVAPATRRGILERMAEVLNRRRYVQTLMGEISAAVMD